MLVCQTSHKLAGSRIQRGWQKIVKGKTWSPPPFSQLLVMNASQKRAKHAERQSYPFRDMLGSCLQHFLQLLSSPALSTLTPTFLWPYWSALTMSVWLNGCPVNPSCPRSAVTLETDLRAAAARLRWPCGGRSSSLWGDCGFWSINNGLHWFASVEGRRVKIGEGKMM